MSGAAASEVAKRAIVSIAFSVASWSRPTVSGSSRIFEPADSIIEFTHTTKPSYWFACTWISPFSPIRSASSSISSHVSGTCSTLSLRYQRSCVLDVNGAA